MTTTPFPGAAQLAAMTKPLGGTRSPARGAGLVHGGLVPLGPLPQLPPGAPGGAPFVEAFQNALSGLRGSPAGGAAGGALRGARPAGSEIKGARAVAWARSAMGKQDWNGLCQQFVEAAYGAKGVYASAAQAARGLVTHRGKQAWRTAPPGALLYFAPDETNDHNGHVGIALGNGRMISATPKGVREERLDTPYWAQRFSGWAEPAGFPGRTPSRTSPSSPSSLSALSASSLSPSSARSSPVEAPGSLGSRAALAAPVPRRPAAESPIPLRSRAALDTPRTR